MKTKTSLMVELWEAGDRDKALEIAKGFKLGLTREERATLQRGHEARVNPGFFEQLGKEPSKLISDAHELFEQKFIH